MNPTDTLLRDLLAGFAPAFTQPGFALFLRLVQGWILCAGRHTLTRIYALSQIGGPGPSLDAYDRFLRCAKWSCAALWHGLAQALVGRFAPTGPVPLQLDDSAFHKSGRRIEGAGWWRDAVRSTGTKVVHCFGLNLLVLTLRVIPPWGGEPLALPINLRLQRKQGPGLLELAAQMIQEVTAWFPERNFELVADGFFASLAGAGWPRVQVYSRMRRDAALYEPAPKRPARRRGRRRGRPRKRGRRLPTPQQLSASVRRWTRLRVVLRGRPGVRLVHVRPVLWYAVCPTAQVLLVIVRDPQGQQPDDYFFTTDRTATPAHVLETYAGRWAIEDTFRNVKQLLGGEHPQLWRGRGPERAAMFAFWLYSLIWLGYLIRPKLQPTWLLRVWYPQKRTPAFLDALAYWRRQLWQAAIFSKTDKATVPAKNIPLLLDTLAYAA